jgi:hypothetical protein
MHALAAADPMPAEIKIARPTEAIQQNLEPLFPDMVYPNSLLFCSVEDL